MDTVAQPEGTSFAPGTLWTRVQATTERALACGALQPIPTDSEYLDDGGIRFLVRILRHLAGKPRRASAGAPLAAARPNPFLPFEPAMYVADASPTHVCLLNKFNVVERHLLLVTRAFEDQETPLTRRDFEALWTCLAEGEGLGFYNSGAIAGASQPHRHLQLIPLALDPAGAPLPIASRIDLESAPGVVGRMETLPFAHAIAALDADRFADVQQAAALTCDLYRRLLDAIGVAWPAAGERFARAYNLLLTRRWLLAVPRTRECYQSISCNALAFAGAWLVRDRPQLELLQRAGPCAGLRWVTEA